MNLQAGPVQLILSQNSQLVLNRSHPAEKALSAELLSGTLAFSVPSSTSLEVSAAGAVINPVGLTRTTGQVTILGPKVISVYARSGSLRLSYGSESEIVTRGQAYRVVLDPPDDSPSQPQAAANPSRPSHHRGFLLFLIVPAALVLALSGPGRVCENSESPTCP